MKSMTKVMVGAGVAGVAFGNMLVASPATAAETECTPTTPYTNCVVYTYAGGDQAFTVPAGITEVHADVRGAGGGGSSYGPGTNGGAGGKAKGIIPVSGGDTLTITAGGIGAPGSAGAGAYGGGGAGGDGSRGSGGAGGGLSAIWDGAYGTSPLLVAGGGGGESGAGSVPTSGGGGGGSQGGAGRSTAGPNVGGGGGGSQTEGGVGGAGDAGVGRQFAGGAGGTGVDGGGGGGAGWYGGGGGMAQRGLSGDNNDGGGGGGAGYLATSVRNAANTTGDGAAPGQTGTVTLQWTTVAPVDFVGATTDARPVFSGTGEPGATVTVTLPDGTVLATTTVTPEGTWSVPSAVELADGEYTVTATQTGDGLTASTDTMTVTVVGAPLVDPMIAGGAGVALLAGVGAVVAIRRRRTAQA